MKKQSGFIQMFSLFAIVIGILIVSGVSYVGIKQYRSYQAQKAEKEKIAIEKEGQVQDLIIAQQKTLEEMKQELDKTKGIKQKVNTQNVKNDNLISASELEPYLNGIVQVECENEEGSGSLWNINGQYSVLTNQHVIQNPYPDGRCDVVLYNRKSGETLGVYSVFPLQAKSWNQYSDVALLKLYRSAAWDSLFQSTSKSVSPPIENLNYKISYLPKCSEQMPVASQITIIGYPAFGIKNVNFGDLNGIQANLISTNGVVSGYDTTAAKPLGNLPYTDYFVSAKIDSGNSGGIAISKNSNGRLCVLGIPTWISVGNYETQGLVQNIHNIMAQ